MSASGSAATPREVPKLGGVYRAGGESWETYARRLEARIKEQREQIRNISELRDVPGDKKARTRIAHLERLLGKKEAQLALQHDGLNALKARVTELSDPGSSVEEREPSKLRVAGSIPARGALDTGDPVAAEKDPA